MGTTSSIRRQRSGRQRLVGVAVGLCALTVGLFTLVSPLFAQGTKQFVIRAGDESYSVAADELQGDFNGDIPVYDGDNDPQQVHVTNGATLEQLLARAEVPEDIKTIQLERGDDAGPLFVPRDADILFWADNNGDLHWQRLQRNDEDENAPDQNTLPTDETKMVFHGYLSEPLRVTASASPTEGVKAGEQVTFTVEVKNPPDDEKLSYAWDFNDGETQGTTETTITHTYNKKKLYTANVIVRGETSRGADTVDVNVQTKPKDDESTDGGSGSGGSSGGTGGSGGSGGTGGSTGPSFGGGTGGTGGFPSTPPSTSPALPPPDTPPPATPTTPNDDSFGTIPPAEPGEEVTGILVSAPTSAGADGGASATKKPAPQPKQEDEAVDWKVPSGAILAGLLLILGALREHRPMRQLLPKAT